VIVVNESPGRLAARSAAKLNLFLEVKGQRADGMHDIETVFQEVAIYDELEFERLPSAQRERRIEFICDIEGLAPEGENLVERAARAFFHEATIAGGVRIRLHKRIPSGAGLGGGSSNAATTLLALQRVFGVRFSLSQTLSLAASLGSDCAFFVRGGAAIGRGRGERLEAVELPRRFFLVVVPHIHCATSAIYGALARRRKASLNTRDEGDRIVNVKALRGLDRQCFEQSLFNRLEAVAFEEFPALKILASHLTQICKVPFHLTGSGSGLFTACERLEDAMSLRAVCLSAACQDLAEPVSAGQDAERPPRPITVRTFVAESLEQRPF
jgi:4-diphosphocytidyl-2-C-methyl-D-erythritol kinase